MPTWLSIRVQKLNYIFTATPEGREVASAEIRYRHFDPGAVRSETKLN